MNDFTKQRLLIEAAKLQVPDQEPDDVSIPPRGVGADLRNVP